MSGKNLALHRRELNNTLEDAFHQSYPGFWPANDNYRAASAAA